MSPQETVENPSLEALVRSGMTPAQAYQAQVYQQSPTGQLRERRSMYGPRDPHVPRLDLEPPDTRLDLDFLKTDGFDGEDRKADGSGA